MSTDPLIKVSDISIQGGEGIFFALREYLL